ncbi:MAG: phosphate ABC transporter permease subunit PstC [Cyanobacteria bacterium J06627_8]
MERGFRGVAIACVIGVGLLLGCIVFFIAIDALPAIQSFGVSFIIRQSWNPVENVYGAGAVIYGTLASSAIALLIAVPLGVGTAIFLSEDIIPASIGAGLVFLVELLAAIPSVVYGLWGIFVLIPAYQPIGQWLHEHLSWIPLFSSPPIGPGLLPAGMVLAIMILPIITAISRDSFAALPIELREAAMSVGASRWRTIVSILIPSAFSGIVGSIMLALGRALGETMAVTMIIGNVNRVSWSVLAPTNTIASLLANQFAEARDLQISALMYAALILVMMTLAVNIMAQLIVSRVRVIDKL